MTVRVLDDYYLGITAIITIAYQMSFFVIAWFCQFDKVTDFAGGSNFAILALITLTFGGTYHDGQIVASVFVITWGFRLGLFCLYRILKTGHDSRFDGRRENFASFLGFWIFQIIWVWIVSLPVTLVNSPRVSTMELDGRDVKFGSATDILGIVLWVIGFLCETIADAQKFRFRQNRKSSKEFMKSGIWAWSRHPNYFGEIVLWWGIFLLCLEPTLSGNTKVPWLSIASPIFTMIILLGLSGLPFNERPTAEKQYTSGNWDNYSAYLKRTSILIPFPPVIYEKFPQWVKSTIFLEFPIYRYTPQNDMA
ncbi:7129_t:CDS:2 [Paraglomus brasilianum]|uniref:7129_t:CDS:1 n=1 Tax=Paraglomus brasilianum TaxID=144538 RepID=A0A9N8WC26_9GLOM|nr:7129_t:CDS:2 [Paraglomus brasilianum]